MPLPASRLWSISSAEPVEVERTVASERRVDGRDRSAQRAPHPVAVDGGCRHDRRSSAVLNPCPGRRRDRHADVAARRRLQDRVGDGDGPARRLAGRWSVSDPVAHRPEQLANRRRHPGHVVVRDHRHRRRASEGPASGIRLSLTGVWMTRQPSTSSSIRAVGSDEVHHHVLRDPLPAGEVRRARRSANVMYVFTPGSSDAVRPPSPLYAVP